MKICVLGLGYVGSVSAACLAKAGHSVIGVDIDAQKVRIIREGRSPVVEPGLEELIAEVIAAKTLRVTCDPIAAVAESEMSLVCVGTPSHPNGSLDLTSIGRVCQQIGAALQATRGFHVVAVRSTVLPGTTLGTIVPALEAFSGKRCGRDFGVAFNPEFLREGSSLQDFRQPPFSVLGTDHPEAERRLRELYAGIPAPVVRLRIGEAEMIKYACNSFHALKVTFANEIGSLCDALDIDGQRVMEVFCQDTKLNLSASYLRPGFAFGGSCLPKDLRALTYRAKQSDLELPLLNSILASNRRQLERAVETILRTRRRRIGVLGLSFKPKTDDLRESPMVTLVETLIGRGLQLAIYDRDVRLRRLHGANADYIEREIPHISSLMCAELEQVVERSEVLVIGKPDEQFRAVASEFGNGRVIIDLAGLFRFEERRPHKLGRAAAASEEGQVASFPEEELLPVAARPAQR
jgi:GDP-mannose 6-dehydrogenase